MDIDDFIIRLGRVIGIGTGIEVEGNDALYWRLGHFIIASTAILALLGIVGLAVLLISELAKRRNK